MSKNEIPLKETYRLFWEFLRRSKNPQTLRVPFNQFWKINKAQQEREDKFCPPPPSVAVVDFSSLIKWYSDSVNLFFEEVKKRGPSLKEFQDHLIFRMKSPQKLFLEIDLWNEETPEDLMKKISKLISEKKKENASLRPRRWKIPTSKVYREPFERYLQVLDKFKADPKCTWKDIANQIPCYKKRYEAAQTEKELNVLKAEISDDKKHACNLIKNAERGDFPGQY